MSIFAMMSAVVEGVGPEGTTDGGGVRGPWGGTPARRIEVGVVERRSVEPDGGENRFGVTLEGGRVYTVEFQAVPRGAPSDVSLYGPSGDLIACAGGWGRVRLVHTAPADGYYAVAATVGPGVDAFVLRVLPWTADEVARATEDPLYVY